MSRDAECQFRSDLKAVLRRFWGTERSVRVPLWEAPAICERYEQCRAVPTTDWIEEAVFQMLEVGSCLDDRLREHAADQPNRDGGDDLLFHAFSLLGYHLLGSLHYESLQQQLYRGEDADETSGDLQEPPATLLASYRPVREAFRAASRLKDLDDERFYTEFPRWVVSVIRSLLRLLDEQLKFSAMAQRDTPTS